MSEKTKKDGWFCPECETIFEEQGDTIYECSCGNIFSREETGTHKCPECNKFASKLLDHGCPDCMGEELEEIEYYECSNCGSKHFLEDSCDSPSKEIKAKIDEQNKNKLAEILNHRNKYCYNGRQYLEIVCSDKSFEKDMMQGSMNNLLSCFRDNENLRFVIIEISSKIHIPCIADKNHNIVYFDKTAVANYIKASVEKLINL